MVLRVALELGAVVDVELKLTGTCRACSRVNDDYDNTFPAFAYREIKVQWEGSIGQSDQCKD